VNLTRDGRTTRGVLEALTEIGPISPDIVTLTAGGNDLLECALEFRRPAGSSPVSPKEAADRIIENYKKIAVIFVGYGCPVIVNTVYDPSGGSDDLVKRMGIAPQWRETYNRLNAFIRSLPETMGFGSRTCKRCSMATVSPPTIRGL
jgi:lysophospholipase L1-like esterase